MHSAPYTVEAEFLKQEDIDKEIHELLFSFRDFYRPGLAEELETLDQEYREIERKSEVAFMTLESIFSKKIEVTQDFLLQSPVKVVEQELRDIARNLPWPQGSSGGFWTTTATTTAGCHREVTKMMKKELWPLTNVVRYVAYDMVVVESDGVWAFILTRKSLIQASYSQIYLVNTLSRQAIIRADFA